MSFSSSVEALRDIDASGSRAHVNETPSSDPFLDAETAKSAEKDKKEHVMRALRQAQQTSLRAASSREDFFNVLTAAAKFYHYSGLNPLRIYLQRPNAKFVASEGDWKKRGYVPIPGSEIFIRAPRDVEFWYLGEEDHTREVKAKLKPCKTDAEKAAVRQHLLSQGYTTRRYTTFVDAKVYSLEDLVKIGTDLSDPFALIDPRNRPPEPVPPSLKPEVTRLSGEGKPEIIAFVEAALKRAGYQLVFEDLHKGNTRDGRNGYSTVRGREAIDRVVIHSGNEPAQQQKTALHELAHVLLGHTDPTYNYALLRRRAEIEAEGLAFVLANRLGIDATPYSVGYIDHWAKNEWLNTSGVGEVKLIEAAFKRIGEVASDIYKTYFDFDELDPAGAIETSLGITDV